MLKQFVLYLASALLIFVSCENTPHADSSQNELADPFLEQLKIEIYDSTALELIDPNASFEILAKGFYWSEGPLWVDDLQSLIFSDVPANKIYQWNEKDSLSIYLESSGHSGKENKNSDKGSNGLILDQNNKLILCQHGDRRIARMDAELTQPKNEFTSIATHYKGEKCNSPNDLVMDKAGNIYFTDPPYGRPNSKTGAIGINGVYKVNPDKEVSLLIDSLSRPNGIGLSPDQHTLYINQSDLEKAVLYAYRIAEDGALESGRVLFDYTSLLKNSLGLPDGLKVHRSGHIFATGPGGVHIISPEGKLLATIKTGKATSNCAFNNDQNYLYTTTSNMLLRVKLE
mgnify:CR=1 FL=1